VLIIKSKEKGKVNTGVYSSSPFFVLASATSTLLDEVRRHQGHPLCNKSWLQCVYKSSLEL